MFVQDISVSQWKSIGMAYFQVVQDIASALKSTIIERLRATPYLYEQDKYGLDLITEFEFLINNITLYTDLDSNDKNLSVFYDLERSYTLDYSSAYGVSTGCKAIDVAFAHGYALVKISQRNFSETSNICE